MDSWALKYVSQNKGNEFNKVYQMFYFNLWLKIKCWTSVSWFLMLLLFLFVYYFILSRTEFLPQESDSLSKALERLARGVHHGVVLVPFDSIAYHNKYKSEVGMISRMKNELRILPLGMHYPKKSPLPEVFDKIIADLQPSGLINFFADSYGTYAYVQEDQNSQGEPIPLNTEHLLGCYVLYLMLNGAAIVVFICEVSCKKLERNIVLFEI